MVDPRTRPDAVGTSVLLIRRVVRAANASSASIAQRAHNGLPDNVSCSRAGKGAVTLPLLDELESGKGVSTQTSVRPLSERSKLSSLGSRESANTSPHEARELPLRFNICARNHTHTEYSHTHDSMTLRTCGEGGYG